MQRPSKLIISPLINDFPSRFIIMKISIMVHQRLKKITQISKKNLNEKGLKDLPFLNIIKVAVNFLFCAIHMLIYIKLIVGVISESMNLRTTIKGTTTSRHVVTFSKAGYPLPHSQLFSPCAKFQNCLFSNLQSETWSSMMLLIHKDKLKSNK